MQARQLLAFAVLLCAAFLSGCNRLPSFVVQPGREVVVDEARLSLGAILSIDSTEAKVPIEATAVGRTYLQYATDEIAKLRPPKTFGQRATVKARRGLYFDVWEQVEKLQLEPVESSLCMEFEIATPKSQSAYLAIGAADTVVVFVNGVAVWARCGRCETRYSHHLIRIPTELGSNRICVALQKAKHWQIVPTAHWAEEWSVNVELFANEEEARHAHRFRVMHPLDTPLVRSIDDLRSDNPADIGRAITLQGKDGTKLASGVIAKDLTINWDRANTTGGQPFLGYCTIEGGLAEPVAVFGDSGVDGFFENLIKAVPKDSRNAWDIRLRHLLLPDFKTSRDVWWARKVTIAALKRFGSISKQGPMVSGAECPSMETEFGSYISEVDGTNQFFRYFRLTDRNAVKALLVIVPTVPSPVRPYLETYSVADLRATEQMVGASATAGMDIIWTGGACVDYGGDLARKDVQEALNAYLRHFEEERNRRTILLGTCSSGVTALGVVKSGMSASSVLLWSPGVTRRLYRWDPSHRSRLPEFPSAVLKTEETNSQFERFAGPEYLVYYDTDAEGHGNRSEAATFACKLRAARCTIDEIWLPQPDQVLEWGIRADASIRDMLRWCTSRSKPSRDASHVAQPTPVAESPVTAKRALLNGVSVTEEFINSRYFNQWRADMALYRGDTSNFHRDGGKTRLNISIVRIEELVKQFGDIGPGLQVSAAPSRDPGSTYWGYLLHKNDSGQQEIQILTNLPEDAEPPHVDLLIDGCCSAALWRRDGRDWKLVNCWL